MLPSAVESAIDCRLVSSHAVRSRRLPIWLWAVAIGGLQAACAREPITDICPSVSEGDIVVTEVRGAQTGEDAYGQWIELYNASGAAIDLQGLELSLLRVDGGASGSILIRDSVPVDAGGYAVIGRFDPGEGPDFIDYGYVLPCEGSSSGCDPKWLDTSLYDAAAVDVIACGVRIDRAIYRDLPTKGTWSFDGAMSPPDATANDDEASWCVDNTEDINTATLGYRGTPGEENRPCN